MFEPVEGIHYLFDRYAYLGLTPDATKEDIHKAVRQRRAENHTDRFIKAGPEAKATAEKVRGLVDDCARFLLNDDLRPLYDERLATFRTEKPELITETGVPIISLRHFNVDLDGLLQGKNVLADNVEEMARSHVGFSEKSFEKAKNLYQRLPDDPDMKDLYRQAIGGKMDYLEVLEQLYWMQAGVYGQSNPADEVNLQHPDQYVEAVNAQIATVADHHIPTALGQRHDAMQIGIAAPLLLAAPALDKQAPTENLPTTLTNEALAEIAQRARTAFMSHADRLRHVASQKKECLETLVSLTDYSYLRRPSRSTGFFDIYLVKPAESADERQVLVGFRMPEKSDSLEITPDSLDTPETVADLKKNAGPHTVILVEYHARIGALLMPMMHVVQKHLEAIDTPKAAKTVKRRPSGPTCG